MPTTKPPLLDGVIVRERIAADGKTIRQKLFVRAPKNPTTSTTPPKPTDPPAPVAPPPPPPPGAPPPETAPPPTTTDTAAEPTPPPPPPPPPFTPAQDAQLLDLKRANTSWKQISILMDGKPQSQLKDRFKELTKPPGPAAAAEEGPPKAEEPEKTADEKKKEEEEAKKKAVAEEKKRVGEERRRAWEEKKKRQEEEAEKEKEKAGFGGAGEAAPEVKEETKKIVFVDGGRFSIEEIVLVHKLAERYENRKWLEVASKFFDATGKRVHPDEMRDVLSGVGQ